MGEAEGAELLSHLTAEERDSVLRTSAAGDPDDLEQFARSALVRMCVCACVHVCMCVCVCLVHVCVCACVHVHSCNKGWSLHVYI